MTPYKYSDLKQEVALLRQDLNNMRAENERMKESIDRLVNMTELIMERVNENRNGKRVFFFKKKKSNNKVYIFIDIIRPEVPLAGPSQTATPLLSKVLKTAVPKTPKSLLIQGNKDFGDPEKIRAYFKELVDADPDTKGKSEDFRLQAVDSSIKNVRPIVLNNAKKLLRDMKNTTGNEQGLYWQKVPEALKKKRIIDIENQAAFLGINLTECQDHWVALALLRKSYQNNCNPKKVRFFLKKKLIYQLKKYILRMKKTRRRKLKEREKNERILCQTRQL